MTRWYSSNGGSVRMMTEQRSAVDDGQSRSTHAIFMNGARVIEQRTELNQHQHILDVEQ